MPSSAVRKFSDPVEYFTGIRNLQIVGLIEQRGEFRARSTRVDLHRLWMHRFDEDLPRIMKVRPSGRRAVVMFATRSDQPAMQVNGIEISQNEIVKFGLGWEWYFRSSAACEWSTMSLAPGDFVAAGESIIGRELLPPTFARSIAPPPAALSRLRKVHDAAAHLAETAPDILAKPEVARAMEQALIEAVVFCLDDSHSDEVRNVERQRARMLRRLEEVLVANSEQPLYMAELCAQVGASYWTLRDCCLVRRFQNCARISQTGRSSL